MSDWTHHFLLPNVQIQEPVELPYISLVDIEDERVVRLIKKHDSFRRLVGGFVDQHDRRLKPALILINDDAPKSVLTSEAICGFRDAVCLSTLFKSRADYLMSGNVRALWSDYFEIYPWNLDRNFRYLTCMNAATTAVDVSEKFKGQTKAGFIVQRIAPYDIDSFILKEILDV